MMHAILLYSALFAAGIAAWPFLEYVIHGWLSHRFRTPAAAMHWSHHRDASRVFTPITVWLPIAVLLWAVGAMLVGAAPAGAVVLGIVAGFQRYEYVHWRIHFRAPVNARQEMLRVHHLAHHFRNPNAYHGVTTRFFDRLFGTLPEQHRDDYARVAARVPLAGKSNFGRLLPRRVDLPPR
ncbi:sterol desaturase family protein [Candidatus Binatia bacterium]|nr:sterol desaturase family protein [Candidatus Binatia bacterium]